MEIIQTLHIRIRILTVGILSTDSFAKLPLYSIAKGGVVTAPYLQYPILIICHYMCVSTGILKLAPNEEDGALKRMYSSSPIQ